MDRREFLKASALLAVAATRDASAIDESAFQQLDDFDRPDSLYHGHEWESLNPGFWQIKDGSLRRRLENYGDRARPTGFPYHYETHRQSSMPVDYDPSLPHGCLYRRDWYLTGSFTILVSATVRESLPQRRENDNPAWKMYQPGYGLMGVVFGARTQFDSYNVSNQAWRFVWSDDGKLTLERPGKRRGKQRQEPRRIDTRTKALSPGDRITFMVRVTQASEQTSKITAALVSNSGELIETLSVEDVPRKQCEGWFGIVGRGLLDFEVNSVLLHPGANTVRDVPQNECLNCYALGPSLQLQNGNWNVRFLALFRSAGERAEIRIARTPEPDEGWSNVAVAGSADIVDNSFRRYTAVIQAKLPFNPADETLYYTVWKDGRNVTADERIGTGSTGPGTGLVGDVPVDGNYVGRLPRLTAPYRLGGFSCHAINRNVVDPTDRKRPSGSDGSYEVRDQPTYEAYRHLDDYGLQILVWEDDVWYMELLIYPPSTDDAWKIVNSTISGPTTRWQMMRHWNVLNPGDHDYGMDDVKGPEQIAIRLRDGLGQDRDYMRRNFQIVHHLITGDENVDPLENPRKWRRWKMPQRDFSLLILDSRLWRTSQDTRIWDDEGWGHIADLYDRADPTRTLLGEEQFAWLQQTLRTDSSRLICLTGINGLHTVWTGGNKYSNTDEEFAQRDRVAADYAGWVAAGSNRVIELLSSREGVTTVYGDVHNGCILENSEHRLLECSFGPIGRSGGRAVIDGFGPEMVDVDGRPIRVHALYHQKYGSPRLDPASGPYYWNFLEMEFDPSRTDPRISLTIRNIVDPPSAEARGGGRIQRAASETGRRPSSRLPKREVLPDADVLVSTLDGTPVRATRSDHEGAVHQRSLVDVPVGTHVLMTVQNGVSAQAFIELTIPTDNAG